MYESLAAELRAFVAELERKATTVVYAVPEETLKAVRRAKGQGMEGFLHEAFAEAIGSGGISLAGALRREFGVDGDLLARLHQWAPYAKDEFVEALHEAIDRANIRAGNQGVFFRGTPSKSESEEALRLLRTIAHAAVAIRFASGAADSEAYVRLLEGVFAFYALPNTYPEGTTVDYRNLIAAVRLAAMAGGDARATAALKEAARSWYARSGRTFLEEPDTYFTYESVEQYVYLIDEAGLERLRAAYVASIREQFDRLRRKPDLDRARRLSAMLGDVMSWSVCGCKTE